MPQLAGAREGLSSLTRRRLAVGLATLAAGWVSYAVYSEGAAGRAADDHVRVLEQQSTALRAEIDQRRQEIAAAQGQGWLVEEARRLGYVLPGERVFVPVSGAGALPAGGGVDTGPLPQPAAGPATPSATAAPQGLASPGVASSPTPRTIVVPVGQPSPSPGH